MKSVEFIYDFASPNSYLALVKLRQVVESKQHFRDLSVKFTPVFLGGLFKMTNDSPLPKETLEFNYMMKNLERLARSLNVEFAFSLNRFPVNSLKALRGSYIARELGKEETYVTEVFKACWGLDQDITQQKVLEELARRSLNIEYNRFVEFIEAESTKEKLRGDTQRSFERGVFGAPTFFMDGEMYWGTPEILWYIESTLSTNGTKT